MRLSPFVTAVAVLAGSSAWAQESPDLEHFDTIEKAVEATKKSKKDIIVDFTGSDWCGWCIKLDQEVFSQEDWKKEASAKYVFVTLDYPRRKSLPADQKSYNEAAQKKYGIQGFPTILVLTSDGALFGRTGYKPGGPAGYLEHLAEMGKRKADIAALSAKIKKNDVAALEQLVEKAGEWDLLVADYMDMKVKLADTKGPSQARHAADLAREYQGRHDEAKYKEYLEKVRALDAAAAKEIEDIVALGEQINPLFQGQDWAGIEAKIEPLLASAKGNLLQEALYIAAMSEFRQGRKEQAIEKLEKSLAAAPKGPRAKEIPKAIDFLKNKK